MTTATYLERANGAVLLRFVDDVTAQAVTIYLPDLAARELCAALDNILEPIGV